MHISVLQKEVLEYLAPGRNQNFIDCTFGRGGHSFAILKKNSPNGKVLAIDWNIESVKLAESQKNKRLIPVCENFAKLEKIVQEREFTPVSGILFDLGMSSWHLEESGRGFSFLRDEPLDMRYNPQNALRAEDIVNKWPLYQVESVLREYGQERFAKRIASRIISERKLKPIKTTMELVDIIGKAIFGQYFIRRGKIHFATKTFQALRIAVNDELDNLKIGLKAALNVLEPGGRLAVISFHSLEDRIVKLFLKEEAAKKTIKIWTKKPIAPSLQEIRANPRARSAKLRVGQKLNLK